MARLINYIIFKYQQRRHFEALWSMDDRQLRDIGITRGDICNTVYGTPKTYPEQD